MHKLNISKEELFTKNTKEVSAEDVQWIQDWYYQITTDHRPIEHVIWYCEFAWHRFTVTGDTLIPRPETEYMIEAVVERVQQNEEIRKKRGESAKGSSLRSEWQVTLLDIGTGCGVLGLSTLLHTGQYIWVSIFTDLSSKALDVAKGNYEKLKPQIRNQKSEIQFLECSLMDHEVIRKVLGSSSGLSEEETIEGSYEGQTNNSLTVWSSWDSSLRSEWRSSNVLIVANLPYIPEWLFTDNTDPSVHKREPKMAFVGGDDGMDLYRIMLSQIVDLRNQNTEYRKKSEEGKHENTSLLSSFSTLPSIALFLEMMTWQVEILRKEFGEWFEFEEVKTFHFNIRIVKGILK